MTGAQWVEVIEFTVAVTAVVLIVFASNRRR